MTRIASGTLQGNANDFGERSGAYYTHRHPRTVYLAVEEDTTWLSRLFGVVGAYSFHPSKHHLRSSTRIDRHQNRDKRILPHAPSSPKVYKKSDFYQDPYADHRECVPLHDWQVKSFPTCNNLHEIAVERSIYLTSGYYRSVFVVIESIVGHDGQRNRAVLKMLNYHGQDVNDRNMDRHRKDATVSGMLSASRRVVDIYGHCGNSALYEFGERGTLGMRFRDYEEGNEPSDEERLRAAADVAMALSDLHSAGSSGGHRASGPFPAVSHTDLHYDQIIVSGDGRYKLNDFNKAHFHYWNSTSNNGTCPFVYPLSNKGARVSVVYVGVS